MLLFLLNHNCWVSLSMYENDTLHENKSASEASLIDRIYIYIWEGQIDMYMLSHWLKEETKRCEHWVISFIYLSNRNTKILR
jgi:hypothetical protein